MVFSADLCKEDCSNLKNFAIFSLDCPATLQFLRTGAYKKREFIAIKCGKTVTIRTTNSALSPSYGALKYVSKGKAAERMGRFYKVGNKGKVLVDKFRQENVLD